ncbi:MAG: hypothetical protein AAFR98_12745 [Pseudomonadota bacterium]
MDNKQNFHDRLNRLATSSETRVSPPLKLQPEGIRFRRSASRALFQLSLFGLVCAALFLFFKEDASRTLATDGLTVFEALLMFALMPLMVIICIFSAFFFYQTPLDPDAPATSSDDGLLSGGLFGDGDSDGSGASGGWGDGGGDGGGD